MTKVNDTCFGVTDHHMIIPMKVIGREEIEMIGDDDNYFQIETKIDCEVTSYMECHHSNYFKFMWLDDNGLPDKGNVFVNKKDAVAYALKNAEDDVEIKQIAIDAIQRQISKLKAEDNV